MTLVIFHALEQLENDGARLIGNTFRIDDEIYLPLYEAKLFNQFNHRPSTFDGVPKVDRFKMKAPTVAVTSEKLMDPEFTILPRFWVNEKIVEHRYSSPQLGEWRLVFRGMTNVMKNSRNSIFAIVPRVAVGNSAPICILENKNLAIYLLAIGNSFAFDYVTRQKFRRRQPELLYS